MANNQTPNGLVTAVRNAASAAASAAASKATQTPIKPKTPTQPKTPVTQSQQDGLKPKTPAQIKPNTQTPAKPKASSQQTVKTPAQTTTAPSDPLSKALQDLKTSAQSAYDQKVAGMSSMDVFRNSAQQVGVRPESYRATTGALDTMRGELARQQREIINPAYKAYQDAREKLKNGQIPSDEYRLAEDNYRALATSYNKLYDTYTEIQNNAYDWNAPDTASIGDTLDGLGKSVQQVESKLGEQAEQIEKLYADYNAAAERYKANPTDSLMQLAQQKWEKLAAAQDQYNADVMVLQYMYGEYDNGANILQQRYYEDHPTALYAQNIGGYDEDGSYHVTESWDDTLKRIDDLQAQASKATGDQAKKLNDEIQFYWDMFDTGYYDGLVDVDQMRDLADTLEPEVKAARLAEQQAREAVSNMEYMGTFEGPEYEAAKQRVTEAQYNLAELQKRRGNAEAAISQLTYRSEIEKLPTELQVSMDDLIDDMAEAGDFNYYLRNRNGDRNGDVTLSYEMHSPEIVSGINSIEAQLRKAGYSSEQVEGMLMYMSREANKQRVRELQDLVGQKSYNAEYEALQNDYEDAKDAAFRLLQIGYTEDSPEYKAAVEARDAALDALNDYDGVHRSRSGFGNWLASLGNGLASGTGYLDLAMQKADIGVDPFTGRAMQIDYNTNPNDFYAREQAISSAQMDRYFDKAFEKYGPTEKAEKVAQRKMNIYQLTESMTQSALVAALSWAGAGPAGLLMLSGSAATQTAQDMHERGYSDGAAILGGFVAGAAEYVTENLPTEHLLGMLTRNAGVLTGKDLLISVGLNQLTQSIEEGLEEGSSDIINLMFEQMAADLNGGGLDSIREEALDAVKQARINGKELSYEDALKGAWTDWTKTWTDDMKAGALSGLFMAGGATMLNGGISAIGNRMGGNEVLQSGNAFAFQQFMDSVDSATLRGANFTPGTGYGRAGKIGRALNNLSSVYVSDAINSRLSELGEESSPALVAAIRHSASGDRLTPVEAAAFNKSEHAQTLANELEKAEPGSWADTAIRAGNDMSMTFRGHDASGALANMVVAQSAPTMKDLASYKVRLGSEGTAEQKVQKVIDSGFASSDEIRDIVKTPALRAAYESVTGTELPKDAAAARKEIRAKLPPLEGNAAAEEYLSMQRSNPDSTILRPIATELTEAGITSGAMAQSQGAILEKVFSGEDLTPFELGKLDLNNTAVRAVFARRSGMTNIPEDLNITPVLKKAYVDTVSGQVKTTRAAQQSLADSADQLMDAQAQSSAARVAGLTSGAQTAGAAEQAPTPGKSARSQNKAAEAQQAKLKYKAKQREAARGKAIVTKGRTPLDILKQVRKQANDNGIVLKPAFADIVFPGVTNLTAEQKAQLDDQYRKYLEKKGLSRAEVRALFEASDMVGAKNASTAAEVKTEVKTEAKTEDKTEAKTEEKTETKTEEKPKATPIRAAVKTGLDQNNSAFRLLRSSKNITQRTIRQLDFLGRALGLQIRFEQSIEAGIDPTTGEMRYANAQYVPGQRVLRIAIDTDDPVSVAVIHEAVHELYRNNRAAFNELRDTVYSVMEQNPEVFDTLKTAVAKEYNTSKDSALTEEEIVCQAVGVVLAKTDVLDRMPANGKVILRNAIIDLLDKLRGYKDGVGGTTALYEDAFHDLEKAADRLAEQFSRGLQEQEAKIRQTNADLVGIDHEATIDLRHDTAPETREPSDMTRYSMKSLAEAAGFQFDPITRTFRRNGAEVRHVTDEDIENSPIGALINYSYDQGYLGAVNSEEAKANRESQIRMFAQVADLCAQGGDFAMNMQVMGATLFTGMKANSDKQYNLTYDFPSICTKTQSMIDQMSARMMRDRHGLTKQELLTLYRETFFEGLPVPCPECYVFTHWVGIGGLLDNIWRYQETYKNKTPEQVRAEYDRINAELDKTYQAQLGNENSKTRSQVRNKMRKDATKALEELTATISSMEANGDTVPTELQAELDAAQSVSDMLDALSWIDTVYFKEGSNRRVRNENFYVPAEILFDLNGNFHTVEGKGPQRFADNYPEAWRFRTTQGAGYGKAITPYAEAELGAGIMITNDKSQIKVKAGQKKSKGKVVQWNNQFLQQKGHLNAATKKILDSAHKKQRAQAFLGGQRFQSTSDARFENVTDYLIAALEMQAMGGAVQVYTKVSGAVELFELLGFSTNQSLMPKGNGLTPDLSAPLDTPVGGMKLSVAEENRQKHEHAGTITIGVNDRHIRLMMREWVRDFIIPYHISGGDKNLIASFREVQEAGTSGMQQATIQSTDYTQTQGDKILTDEALKWMGKTKEDIDLIKARRQQRINILTGKGALDMNIIRGSQFLSELYDKLHGGEWDGVTVGKGVIESQIFPNEFWNTEVTYEQSGVNTKRYLDYCEELGFLHRFSGQRMKAVNVVGADGVKRTETHIMPVNGRDAAGDKYPLTDLAYVYDEAGNKTSQIEDFFWKTIVDRRMYGNDGRYLPQAQITLNAVTKGDVENFARNNAGSAREYDKFKSEQLAARLVNADLNALYEEQEAKLAEMRKNGSAKASTVDRAAETLGVRNSLKTATEEQMYDAVKDDDDGSRFLMKVADKDKKLLSQLEKAEQDGEVVKVYRAMQAQPVDENGEVIKASVQRIVSYDPLMVEALVPATKGTKKNPGTPAHLITVPAKLFSPMAGQSSKGVWRNPIDLNEWEMSEGHLERATMKVDKDGNPVLDKDKKNASYGEPVYVFGLEKGGIDDSGKVKGSVPARYNPYIHTSLSALNDQFSSANKRPELVTVETLVPKSELTVGKEGRFPGAKDAPGAMSWHSGPASSRLAHAGNPRVVILSRFDKPVRVVPDSEVAASIKKNIGAVTELAIPESTVTPSLAAELRKIGVEVLDEAAWDEYAKTHPVEFFDAQAKVDNSATNVDNTDSGEERFSLKKNAYGDIYGRALIDLSAFSGDFNTARHLHESYGMGPKSNLQHPQWSREFREFKKAIELFSHNLEVSPIEAPKAVFFDVTNDTGEQYRYYVGLRGENYGEVHARIHLNRARRDGRLAQIERDFDEYKFLTALDDPGRNRLAPNGNTARATAGDMRFRMEGRRGRNYSSDEQRGLDAGYDHLAGGQLGLEATPADAAGNDAAPVRDHGRGVDRVAGVRQENSGEAESRNSLKSARMTEKRIDDLIADSGAGKSKTYAQKWITSINPSDFLSLTLKADKQDREVFDRMPGDYGSTVNDFDYIEGLKNETRQTPFLMIDSSGQVIGHEGRHRMRALEREGVNSAEVVVQIYSRDGRLMKNAHEINGRLETIRKFVFTNQYGTGQTATVQNIIPLNLDHRDEILAAYGEGNAEENDIRYSKKRTDSEQRAFEQGRFVQGAQMAKEQRLANDAAQKALRRQQAKTAAAEAKAATLKAEAAAKAAQHKANLELAKQRKSEQMKRINTVFRANGSPVRVGSNSDLSGAIDYELKRRQQLLNEAKDKLVDSQWETKMAQSDGEQKLKAVQRYWKDKFDYAHKTDKQWARGLKKSERQGTKAEGRRRTKEALALDRMDHSETARRAIRERNAFNRRGDEIVINDGQNVATPAPFTDERKVLQKAADFGKHAAKQIYGTFVNYAYGLEKMAKLQSRQDDLDVMVRMVRASSSTVERCFESGLVDRNGDIIGPAAKDILLWTDAKGRLMKDLQAAQNDYMFHKHNVDRRSVETKARERVLQMQTQYPWLAEMSNQELGRLAASGNSIVNDYVQALRHANDIAARMRANPHYLAVFGDEDGNAFSAESSQRIVDEYERTMPQLKERAEQIYEWWDIFMREWAVGGSISMSQYEDMREMYPHYVPTYRKDNGPHAGGVSGNPAGLSAKPSTKRAVGSIRELEAMEDQYINSMKKIIQGNRENAILRNIVEEFLFDEDGTFSDFGYFDLDSLTVSDRLDLLEFADESRLQSLTKHDITVDGKTSEVYHISCWVDGRKMSAYVNKEIFTGLKALFGQQDQFVRTATKIGHKVTSPMKKAITGVNPNFVLRNPMRDVQTALVNSVAGFAYVKYLGQAMAQMAEHSGNWTTFQNLGGVSGSQMSNESGFTEWAEKLTSTGHKIAEIVTKPGEITEAAARFAEYLATLDMLGGDTPENRMVAIRNAARVTVDFGQRGTLGGLINAWVPYWNPNIQGIDLMIKNVAGQPTVKQALARLGRAAVVNILPQAIALAVIYGRGHKDDWDELSDQVKDNFFCLPIPGSRKFLKIPKSQDWGALIATPFMRMIDGVMGRDDPFENYGVSAVLSNYNPLAWPIGLDWVMELKANKNFAGSAIIPYDLQDVSKREQYDKDTSMVSFAIARALGQSPMAIDYILSDYFGNFYGALLKMLPVGYVTDEVEPVDKVNEMLQSMVNPWVADPLYSNSTVSYYYDAINGLRQKVTDTDAHGSSKGTREAAILSALESSGGYISKISALSAQARELTKGDEKDALKLQIAGLADEALQFLKDCESGDIKDPELYMTYHKYGDVVMKEAENLQKYADEFNFSGKLVQPKTFYDPDDKSHKYTLTDEQTAAYSQLREDAYKQTMINTISSARYRSAAPAEKAALLEAARTQALDKAEVQFADMLRDEKVSFETIGKAGYDEERFAAAYGISEILGTDSAYSSALTDAMVNLYEYKTDYSFVPSYGDTKTFNSTTDSGMRYVLTNAQQTQYTNIRHDNFQSYADKVMKSSEWKSASPELQAAMLAEAKKLADKQSKKDFDQWLRSSGAVAQPKAQSNEVVVQEAQYAIDRVTGDSYALDKRVSDTLIRLWDYKDAGPNANFELDTLSPSATYAYDKQYQWVLNDEQKEVYRSIAGTLYNKHVLAVINAPGFDRLSDEEQARRIGVIRADLTAEVRETFKQWLIDHNVKPTPKKTTADLVSQQKIDASRQAVNVILGR